MHLFFLAETVDHHVGLSVTCIRLPLKKTALSLPLTIIKTSSYEVRVIRMKIKAHHSTFCFIEVSKRLTSDVTLFITSLAYQSAHKPEACFSKVPKLFGPISGGTIPFISSQRRGSKPSNIAILLVFLSLKTRYKIIFSKQADCSLTTGFSGVHV